MKKRIAVLVIAAVVVIASAIRIVYINTNAEEYKVYTSTYEKGETFNYKDYDIKVNDIEILDRQGFIDRYGESDYTSDDDIRYAIVSMDYRYVGEEQNKPFDVSKFTLTSGVLNNGLELITTMKINCGSSGKQEVKDYKLVFFISKKLCSNSGWKKVSSRSYQLGIEQYPYFMVVNL